MAHDFNTLVNIIKKYNSHCDFIQLRKAYEIADAAHQGQKRQSGDPYIIHPLEVAIILAELELDETSIIAGILHDVIEDTDYAIQQIQENFGDDVALLVDGVTKLDHISYNTKEERQAESLRKMFLAMAKDIRVILIKLADRLHNIRTLKYSETDKQVQKARETLEIYTPLAHRLGISKIKWELEDLCLRYIEPVVYYDLVEKIAKNRKEREAYINKIINDLKIAIGNANIDVAIDGRPKHFYSIYRKMKLQNKPIDQIYDLFAIRAIVNSVHDCYAVLGLVHELYKPIPGKFKDYIAMPKPNMYQSLHTIIITHDGERVEVQIRTKEMHRVSEVGIAAHWKYKEGATQYTAFDSKLVWLRQLLEWQKEMRDAKEFMESLKIDLFDDEVFVFTPTGDVRSFPNGSTPIDFAYSIHSDIGNKMIGSKVNGKITTLDYRLQNGDIIEILTSANSPGPSRNWLKLVKSSQAKNKINQWLRKQNREEDILKGKDIIEKELKKQKLSYNELFKHEWVDLILKKYNFISVDNMYSQIGYGAISANKIISRLKEEYEKSNLSNKGLLHNIESEVKRLLSYKVEKPISSSGRGILVNGVDNCLFRLSKCCNPVPGDDIIGYLTKTRGVSIHRKDCANIIYDKLIKEKLVDVQWPLKNDKSYFTDLTITGVDKLKLLTDLTNTISKLKIPIKSMSSRTGKNNMVIINLTLEISGIDQLSKIMKKIAKNKGIINIDRA